MPRPIRSDQARTPARAKEASADTPITLLQVEAAINRLRRRPPEVRTAGYAYDLHEHQRKQLEELYRRMVSSRTHVVPLMQVPASARGCFHAWPDASAAGART
ncbi:DUF3717 domain-containing protein (plasmid) [Burkholderia sp. MS455]|uniref:DUF3717 domain-containing protein n=1 Tax=Burkholderia sp. MS455 TaxID=2811788 RepID=UPI00195EF013|nr:DUF3717 domain-containing protein [Burkholderia sp. MS455]QRR11796.1 DUF3717 domain-containing protein [Burkholderia sp. MS455]